MARTRLLPLVLAASCSDEDKSSSATPQTTTAATTTVSSVLEDQGVYVVVDADDLKLQ